MPRQLDEYLSFILLRDIITHTYFTLDAKTGFKPFWRHGLSLDDLHASLIKGAEVSDFQANRTIRIINSILSSDTYNVSSLASIPIFQRIWLIQYLPAIG